MFFEFLYITHCLKIYTLQINIIKQHNFLIVDGLQKLGLLNLIKKFINYINWIDITKQYDLSLTFTERFKDNTVI